ncbi:hypothetical protein KSP40_PGU019396 [Platanthera guangdongensis]|uniref:Uncharacterized protein n=1 Tax=Platanthera guangdongensis TaxID=2320717 RepID=A0ABR2MTC8_9ASPA
MGSLFFYTLWTAYLGWQWRRVRTIQDEINDFKKQVKSPAPVATAFGVAEGAYQEPVPPALETPSPIELNMLKLTERKQLLKGGYRDRHFKAGSILLGFGVLESVGGALNTWLRTGKLFPGPHLFAGAGLPPAPNRNQTAEEAATEEAGRNGGLHRFPTVNRRPSEPREEGGPLEKLVGLHQGEEVGADQQEEEIGASCIKENVPSGIFLLRSVTLGADPARFARRVPQPPLGARSLLHSGAHRSPLFLARSNSSFVIDLFGAHPAACRNRDDVPLPSLLFAPLSLLYKFS